MPNAYKIFQLAVNRPNGNKIHQNLTLQVPPKFTQIRIFGLKIRHLATLFPTIPENQISGITFSCLHSQGSVLAVGIKRKL
jgi:hypothetical protein